MSIFENLENLNVSEECFDEILNLTEQYLKGNNTEDINELWGKDERPIGLSGMRRANQDSINRAVSMNSQPKTEKKPIPKVGSKLSPLTKKVRTKTVEEKPVKAAVEPAKTKAKKDSKIINNKEDKRNLSKNAKGELKTDIRRAIRSADDAVRDVQHNPDISPKEEDRIVRNIYQDTVAHPRREFKEKWGDKLKTHNSYKIENKIKDKAMKKLQNYMNSKESFSEELFESLSNLIVEEITNLRRIAGLKDSRGWDKENDPNKEKIRKKINNLEDIRDKERSARGRKIGHLENTDPQKDALPHELGRNRDEGRDTKNFKGTITTRRRHQNRELYNTNTGNSGIKVGEGSWVGGDNPTPKDIERYNPVVKSIARNMKKEYKRSKVSEDLIEEILDIVEALLLNENDRKHLNDFKNASPDLNKKIYYEGSKVEYKPKTNEDPKEVVKDLGLINASILKKKEDN